MAAISDFPCKKLSWVKYLGNHTFVVNKLIWDQLEHQMILQERAYHSSSPEFVSVATNADAAGGAGVVEVVVGTMSTLLHFLSISVVRNNLC